MSWTIFGYGVSVIPTLSIYMSQSPDLFQQFGFHQYCTGPMGIQHQT